MALDLSKLNFFNRLDARARVFVLFLGVLGFILLIYLATKYFTGSSSTVGPSHVANVPAGLQSVPGGQVTSEYYKSLVQANQQKEQQAKVSGGSAIATIINPGEQSSSFGNNNCNIICSDSNANVKNLLDDWVRQGKISPDVAADLEALANKDVSVADYAAALDQLVKEGKLTPEQARELLEQYKKQHANALLQDSANTMDDLIKSGKLPLDVANELLTDQKNGMNPADYAKELQRLVREGRISPDTAAQLLAQYTQQHAKEAAKDNLATINQMLRGGEITGDVAKDLADLAARNVSADEYAAELQRLVAEGKLTPAAAAKLLAAYRRQKEGLGGSSALDGLVRQAEGAAFQELSDLLKAGKITPDTAAQISGLIQQNVSIDIFKGAIASLVAQKKLTPDIAALKIQDYLKVKNLRDEQSRLANLQANNASLFDYANELKAAVANGTLTPDQAAALMQQYQASLATAPAPTLTGGTPAFAALAQRAAASGNTQAIQPNNDQFAAAQAQAAQAAAADRQARIDALSAAMGGQASQLISSWQPPVMEFKGGTPDYTKKGLGVASTTTSSSTTTTTSGVTGAANNGPPLIKTGTIIFGVLDTAVNSDYPDSPVMVTIVEGKYKGAKLLGKFQTAKNVAGQLDRVGLTFTLMNMEDWDRSKTITAYAIDPDTARTVMASTVDNHYLKRYGAVFAASFVQGYSSAINTSASTSTTGIFGTSTTHPELSPSQKLATAIGQIGQNLGTMAQAWTTIPPTVRVDSGVSLGILFMADVNS